MIRKKLALKKYTLSDGITQSMLASFLACRERSKLQLNGWESAESNTHAMDRGSLYHALLENWYKLGAGERNAILVDGPKYKNFYSSIADSYKPGKINQEWEDTLAGAEAIFFAYAANWSASDFKREWVSLEQTFDIMWRGYRLRGKFDGLYKLNGKLWLFETKTKALIEEDMIFDALAFDFQNLFYLTALKALKTPAIGVLYNIIRTPSERTKKGESVLDKFTVRLPAEIAKKPEHYFKRFEVCYNAGVVERFEQELEAKLKDFSAWWRGEIAHYRNETACISRTRCPFLRVCSSGSLAGFKQTRVLFRELA